MDDDIPDVEWTSVLEAAKSEEDSIPDIVKEMDEMSKSLKTISEATAKAVDPLKVLKEKTKELTETSKKLLVAVDKTIDTDDTETDDEEKDMTTLDEWAKSASTVTKKEKTGVQWHSKLGHLERGSLGGDFSSVNLIPEEKSISTKQRLTHEFKTSTARIMAVKVPRRMGASSPYQMIGYNKRLYMQKVVDRYRSAKQADMTVFFADAGRNNAMLGRARMSRAGLFGFLPDAAVLPLVLRDPDKIVSEIPGIAKAVEANVDRTDLIRYMWNMYSGQSFSSTGSAIFPLDESAFDKYYVEAPSEAVVAERSDIRNFEHNMTAPRYEDTVSAVQYVYSEGSGSGLGALADGKTPDKKKPKKPVVTATYTRPNGEEYHARLIEIPGSKTQIADVDMVKTARESRINVLLKGRPGTGKTALCEASLENLQIVECDASTEAADFLGSYVPTGHDTFEWQDGPLITAAKNGWPLLVDEIALCDTRELAVLYAAMDGRKTISVTSNPEIGKVDIEDGFYVIGACNPDVPGAILSDALLSRFPIQLEVTTDYNMLKKLGVDEDILTVARNLAKQEASKEIMKAPQTRELLDFMRIKKAFGQHAAIASFVASADPVDMDTYISIVTTSFGIKAAPIKI